MALHVQVRGDGWPLVLLPWFGVDHVAMAAAFEPVFAQAPDWSRIYLDLPGTGMSEPVPARSDAVLDAVAATVEEMLGGARFLVAGCSYGGYLAAGLARRMPRQVVGLLTACAGVRIRPGDRDLSRVLSSTPQPQWLADVPAGLHEHFRHAIGCQTRSVANRVAEALDGCGPNHSAYLDELRSTGYPLSDDGVRAAFDGTVMLLAGRRDRVAGFVDAFDALADYRRGNFVALGEAGHYLPFEQPALFKDAVLNWLAESRVALTDEAMGSASANP